jgi:hypothetical protein
LRGNVLTSMSKRDRRVYKRSTLLPAVNFYVKRLTWRPRQPAGFLFVPA